PFHSVTPPCAHFGSMLDRVVGLKDLRKTMSTDDPLHDSSYPVGSFGVGRSSPPAPREQTLKLANLPLSTPEPSLTECCPISAQGLGDLPHSDAYMSALPWFAGM